MPRVKGEGAGEEEIIRVREREGWLEGVRGIKGVTNKKNKKEEEKMMMMQEGEQRQANIYHPGQQKGETKEKIKSNERITRR